MKISFILHGRHGAAMMFAAATLALLASPSIAGTGGENRRDYNCDDRRQIKFERLGITCWGEPVAERSKERPEPIVETQPELKQVEPTPPPDTSVPVPQ